MNSVMLSILIISWFALFPIATYMEGFSIWSFLIGVVFVLFPAVILWWSERGSEANRIAHQLANDVLSFIEVECDKSGHSLFSDNDKDVFDMLPIENERFRIIKTSKGMSWHSKEYDAWFLNDGRNTYYCDHNQNVICIIQIPHKFSLKKSLIPDRDAKELNKNNGYWE